MNRSSLFSDTRAKQYMIYLAILCLLSISDAFAAQKTINLIIDYKTVTFAGRPVKAIAINNQIPGPTLRFKQGDRVTLNVYNRLKEGTSLHWHGLLVPWQMDGVSGVNQNPIPPGKAFRYQFTIEQSGTYWYHSHTGLQEQQGLYGALIIDPPTPPPYRYNKDYVIVLSDWSNTNPNKIWANLKKSGDYYSPKFPLQPSLVRFLSDYWKANPLQRKQLINDYKMMQNMCMGAYDISDVAYGAYLLNGRSNKHPWKASVKVGDTVRLRFIGAATSTIYRVKIPNTTMQLVQAQGNNVKPQSIQSFSIAPGETYDVLVKIRENTPYILYAESIDTLGAAIGALVTDPAQPVNYQQVQPFPVPEPTTRTLMRNRMASKGSTQTAGTKYQTLKAAVKTNNPQKPIDEVIQMELFGDMGRFIWFINGLPEYKAKPITIEPGKRYRLHFTNRSMMRHPMHLHGHWFILRNGHGIYDPLLHTLDVPPGASVVVDLDTDASGQWYFHCHNLYHMVSGMARTFQYDTLVKITEGKAKPESEILQTPYINRPIVRIDEQIPINTALVRRPLGHPAGFYWATLLDIGEDPFHNRQKITFWGLYGGDYQKLQLYTNDAEIQQGKIGNADMDVFYWHLIGRFWALKGGVNYFYRPAQKPYWQPGIGIEGLMPYFIALDTRVYYRKGSTKFDIELTRDTQITNNFFVRTAIRSIFATKTVVLDEIGSGLNQMQYTLRLYYRLTPGITVFTEFENQQYYGAFRKLNALSGEATHENIVTFGLTVLL